MQEGWPQSDYRREVDTRSVVVLRAMPPPKKATLERLQSADDGYAQSDVLASLIESKE